MKTAWNEIDRFLSRYLSPAVRAIFLANVALFVLDALLTPLFRGLRFPFFLLMETPELAVGRFCVWQFATYMFMHEGTVHLLVNMMVLWFFAPRLEYRWGTLRFVRFYFTVGIGAGVFHALVAYGTGNTLGAYLSHDPRLASYAVEAVGKASGFSIRELYALYLYQNRFPLVPMLGASGALYGVLLAYALHYPDDTVLLYFVIPIKIKYLVIFIGAIAFFASITGREGDIAHVTHLGGFLAALLYLRWRTWFDRLRGGRGGPRARAWRVDPRRHPDFR